MLKVKLIGGSRCSWEAAMLTAAFGNCRDRILERGRGLVVKTWAASRNEYQATSRSSYLTRLTLLKETPVALHYLTRT